MFAPLAPAFARSRARLAARASSTSSTSACSTISASLRWSFSFVTPLFFSTVSLLRLGVGNGEKTIRPERCSRERSRHVKDGIGRPREAAGVHENPIWREFQGHLITDLV